MYVKAFDKLSADLSQQLADSAPLTGERTAKRMAAMAPSISSMQKMAIGALEAMDNANRLQQMEKEKEEMRERESSLKQQLAAAEGEKAHREAELQQQQELLRDERKKQKMMEVGACRFRMIQKKPCCCQLVLIKLFLSRIAGAFGRTRREGAG
eukprot:COSAG06_NODE_21453_length_756_cov_0.850837_1_plen_154_part_00